MVANPVTVDNAKLRMKKDNQDTINKSLLLNWLYFSDEDLLLEELGKWISTKTDGQYVLIKNSNVKPLNPLDEIKHK